MVGTLLCNKKMCSLRCKKITLKNYFDFAPTEEPRDQPYAEQSRAVAADDGAGAQPRHVAGADAIPRPRAFQPREHTRYSSQVR